MVNPLSALYQAPVNKNQDIRLVQYLGGTMKEFDKAVLQQPLGRCGVGVEREEGHGLNNKEHWGFLSLSLELSKEWLVDSSTLLRFLARLKV
jgi:hypothetical protein